MPFDMANSRTATGFTRNHGDLLGEQRRIVRHVARVAEQQLQRMSPGRERNLSFGLSCAKMQMIEVRRNRLAKWRQCGIHDQMVVPGIRLVDTGWRDAH